MSVESMTGTVKFFDSQKGFGFIVCGSSDYFVHFKSIVAKGYKELKEGQTVSFTPKLSDKGWLAENVVVIGRSED